MPRTLTDGGCSVVRYDLRTNNPQTISFTTAQVSVTPRRNLDGLLSQFRELGHGLRVLSQPRLVQGCLSDCNQFSLDLLSTTSAVVTD
jgi:hypothetical protein